MCLCFRWCVLTGDHDGPASLLTSDIRASTDIRQSRGAPPHTRPGPPGRPWRPAPASPARWAPWSPESPSSASSAWNRNTISTGRKESGSHYREEVLPVAFSETQGEYISCQKIYDHRGMFLICWCQPWARLVQRTRLCLHHYLCQNLAPASPPAQPDVSMLHAFIDKHLLGENGLFFEMGGTVARGRAFCHNCNKWDPELPWSQQSGPLGLEAVNQENRGDSADQGRVHINLVSYSSHLTNKHPKNPVIGLLTLALSCKMLHTESKDSS